MSQSALLFCITLQQEICLFDRKYFSLLNQILSLKSNRYIFDYVTNKNLSGCVGLSVSDSGNVRAADVSGNYAVGATDAADARTGTHQRCGEPASSSTRRR